MLISFKMNVCLFLIRFIGWRKSIFIYSGNWMFFWDLYFCFIFFKVLLRKFSCFCKVFIVLFLLIKGKVVSLRLNCLFCFCEEDRLMMILFFSVVILIFVMINWIGIGFLFDFLFEFLDLINFFLFNFFSFV